MKHMTFLSGDMVQGRLSGSQGALKAAEYLALELEKANFLPLGHNIYFDQVSLTVTEFIGPAEIEINGWKNSAHTQVAST